LVNSRCENEVDLPDDLTPEEVENELREAMFDMIEWGYRRADEGGVA
jgi:hypothetical protein